MTTSTNSPHKNAVSKLAGGNHDWRILRLVEKFPPEEALAEIEWLILKAVTDSEWRLITPTAAQLKSPSFVDRGSYFSYWFDGVTEVCNTGNKSSTNEEISDRLFELIGKMLEGKRHFDNDSRQIMGKCAFEVLVAMESGFHRNQQWRKFIELASKKGWCDVLLTCLQDTLRHLRNHQTVMDLIQGVANGIEKDGFSQKAAKILWGSLAHHETSNLIAWSVILQPLIMGKHDVKVQIACQDAVRKICEPQVAS